MISEFNALFRCLETRVFWTVQYLLRLDIVYCKKGNMMYKLNGILNYVFIYVIIY